MKKLFLFGLLASVFASAAVTSPIVREAKCAAAANTCTLDATPTSGDLVLVYAFRTTTTAPTLPAGWTQISTASASGSSFRYGCQKGTGSTSIGTWTNATHIVAASYKNVFSNTFATANCNTLVTSSNSNSGAASTTMTYTAIAPITDQSGLSFVFIAGADLTVAPCTPTGTQSVTSIASAGAGPGVAAWDTNAGVTAWGAHTCTVASSSWRTVSSEIKADPCAGSNSYAGWSCKFYASTSGAGNTNSFTSNTAGDLLIACMQGTTVAFAAPTDANTNTWTTPASQVSFFGSDIACWAVLSAKVSAGSNTVTFDPAAAIHGTFIAEFSPPNTVISFDTSSAQPNATSNASTGAITAVAMTTGAANEIVFGALNTTAGSLRINGTLLGGDGSTTPALGTENPIFIISSLAAAGSVTQHGFESTNSDAYAWLQLSFSSANCSSSFFALLGAGCR